MAKIDPLDDVGSLANTTSARAVINSNSQKIEDAFANTLSRDGSAPNQMEADFDLNNHYLLNVADPVNEADGVNLRSVRPLVEAFASQIVETAVFGTQIVDPFTATPGQTDFPLSEPPGSIENVSLFIDELAKLPGTDFTLTGPGLQTLVVTPALSGGETVLIRYTKALPSGVTLSNSVVYAPPSTGIETTVEAFLDALDAGNAAALRADLADITALKGANLVARSVTTDTTQTITGQKLFQYDSTINGPRVEIQKTDTPANYAGTRAAFVFQYKDDEALGANEGVAGAYLLFTSTGDGVVDPVAPLSESIWQGMVVGSEKFGDGSQHSISAIGQLQAYGASGYNELGLVVGNGTNVGSMNGNVTACEFLLKDGTGPGTSGVDNFPTRMFGYISRIARWNSNALPVHSFYASSEGTIALSSVLGINPGGARLWEVGIDFRNALFSSDHAFIMPNEKFISALDSGGALRRIIGTNAANVNLIFANATSGYFQLATTGGVTLIEANHTLDATNPLLLYVNGALKRVTVGAADSGGAGFRYLRVPN